MISADEIKRRAGELGVSIDVIEHDYVLGCFLYFLRQDKRIYSSWVFKGATALTKCYFENYRFSEDLDFTATARVTEEELAEVINTARNAMQGETGIRTDVQPMSVETIKDDYGNESLEGKVYYYGPMRSSGSPSAFQVHVSCDEILSFPVQHRNTFHQYSDKKDLPKVTIPVYALEEVFVEKLRAFSGQRRFAIARDVFDLYSLSKENLDRSGVLKAFPEKCKIKGIEIETIEVGKVIARKEEFRSNWQNNLAYLIPSQLKVDFDVTWNVAIGILEQTMQNSVKAS